MHLNGLLALAALTFSAHAQITLTKGVQNTTREYLLRTSLKPNQTDQSDKCDYENLYLSTYHTGAGLSDAVFANHSVVTKAFLNDSSLEFDLGNTFPWFLVIGYAGTYAYWAPVEVHAGFGGPRAAGTGRFFMNETGLQFTTADNATDTFNAFDEFRGWLVCDWYHGMPQLFWRYGRWVEAPRSCADVYLVPEYV